MKLYGGMHVSSTDKLKSRNDNSAPTLGQFIEAEGHSNYGNIDDSLQRNMLSQLVSGLNPDALRALRAIINGKLSKRQITPEQQTAMQAARKKKNPAPE